MTTANLVYLNATGHGSLDQYAQTPDVVFDGLKTIIGDSELFDPCPADPTFDGLHCEWGALNFVNPPYSQIAKWLDKAVSELHKYNRRSIFLIPFRPHRQYFFTYIVPHARAMRLIKENVTFKGYTKPARLPMCLVFFGDFSTLVRHQPVKIMKLLQNERRLEELVASLENNLGKPFDYKETSPVPKGAVLRSWPWKTTNFIVLLHTAGNFINQLDDLLQEDPSRTFVLLAPARIEDKWFKEQLQKSPDRVTFLSCTLVMTGHKRPSPYGSCLFTLGPRSVDSRVVEGPDCCLWSLEN